MQLIICSVFAVLLCDCRFRFNPSLRLFLSFAAGQLLYNITASVLPQPSLISIYLCTHDLFLFLCFILRFISVLLFILQSDIKILYDVNNFILTGS